MSECWRRLQNHYLPDKLIIKYSWRTFLELEFFTASLINLLINLSYSILALVVGVYGLLWVDDKLLKNIDLEEEMKKGNIAVAIFASTILVFVALIIAFGFRG